MIEKIFYEEIIPECATNNLKVGELKPAICFNTVISGNNLKGSYQLEPTLVINDKNSFNTALRKYTEAAVKFYYNGIVNHDNIKTVMSDVFVNATSVDLKNPVNFLNVRTSFLNWKPVIKDEEKVLGYNAKINIKKEGCNLETPYSFNTTLYDDNDSYKFPDILFGIDGGTAYVYAIQNKFKENNKLKKKVNRLLFKINADFNDEQQNQKINSTDVSMPFVAEVILFIRYLNSINIDKIVIPVDLPIRINNHFESYKRRINLNKNIMSEEQFDKYKSNLDEINNSYYECVSLKLIRTFNRVIKQGDVLSMNYFPFELNGSIFTAINKDGKFNNEFCNDLYVKNSSFNK